MRQWANSLYLGRDYEQCLRVCQDIQRSGRIEEYADLEAKIFLETENFEEAGERLFWLAKKLPQDVAFALNYGICLHRLGRPERAFHVMRIVEGRIGDSPSALMLLGDAYASVGKVQEAVRFAYEALQLAPEDHRAHRNYITLILSLDDTQDIGETYIHAFQKSLDGYNSRFPEHQFFEVMTVVPEDPDALKARMMSLMENPHGDKIENAFRQGLLPLGALAQMAGKDIVTVWGVATSNSEYGLLISTAAPDADDKIISSGTRPEAVIAEPAAVLALNAMNLLSYLKDLYQKVFIAQSFVDDLGQIVEMEQRFLKEGRTSIVPHEGELLRVEVPPAAVREFVSHVSGLRSVLLSDKPFIIIGSTPGREEVFAGRTYDEHATSLGRPTAETLYEARARKIPFLSGDVFTRQTFGRDEGVESIGVLAVLNELRQGDVVGEDEYLDALLDLIELNYRLIPVSSNMLIRAVIRNRFLVNDKSSRSLRTLSDERWVDDGVARVFLAFLRWLWNEMTAAWSSDSEKHGSLSLSTARAAWTEVVLDVLALRTSVAKAAATASDWKSIILGNATEQSSNFLEFDSVVREWLAKQN